MTDPADKVSSPIGTHVFVLTGVSKALYTVLRGFYKSEATFPRHLMKKFELLNIKVARGDKPPEGAVFLYNASAHISYGGTYGNQ